MTKFRPESLLKALREHPRASSTDLCRMMGGVSRATLARWLQILGDRIVVRGGSRRTRYALRRDLRGAMTPLPLYTVDESGKGRQVGQLDLLYPKGSALMLYEPFPWPTDDDCRDGWFGGLPYPLVDMRPQGFIGRNFAHRYALDLTVSANLDRWSESDTVYALAMMGSDQPGNLILGEVAYRRFLDNRLGAEKEVLQATQLEIAYPQLAANALAQGVPGSSAGGEFPKFTARRYLDERLVDVLVKFSGADESPAVRRWADLLVCEHLALESVRTQLGVLAAESAVRKYAGRTFLEVVRFDRTGTFGRSAVCTLASINAALVGLADLPWHRAAQRLHAKGWLAAEEVEKVASIWWFGRLIGNTDMHEGNLAFRPGLTLAPVYDMLPMLYAPLRGGELAPRAYAPELPMPDETAAWQRAAAAASQYWQECLADSRISSEFRQTCADNARTLDQVRLSAF